MIKFKRLRVKQTSIENELKERKKLRILKDFKIPNFKFPKLKMEYCKDNKDQKVI